MKKLWIVLLPVLLAAFIAGAYVLYGSLSEGYAPTNAAQNLTKAEDFTVYDAEGNEVFLSDCLGTPIVVNFWASWCGPCQSEMPVFERAAARYDGEVVFLMVNMTDGMQETVKTASDFIAEQGYTFPIFFDTAQDAAMTYSVASLPTTCFITADGYIQTRMSGPVSSQRMATEIRHLLD